MGLIATGVALGVVVSAPPGPNTVLCINLARDGVRRAMPVIASAALADAAYSLLAASGILVAARIDAEVLTWLAPCFMLATAVLAWTPASISPRTAAGIVLFNPATIAIWLALSSAPALQALSVTDLLLRPLPVALGTAVWFLLLAVAASRIGLQLSARARVRMQRILAGSLGLLAVASAAAHVC